MNVKRLGPRVSHSPCWCWRQASPLRGCRRSHRPRRPGQAAAETKIKKSTAAKTARVAIQVNQNEKGVMDLALNNAKNISDYYKAKGQDVVIEIVTFGPGLHMLRTESPVKERVAAMSLEVPPHVRACGNTQANMTKAEGSPVTLLSEAKVTPSGVVRLMELQGQGYAYIKP